MTRTRRAMPPRILRMHLVGVVALPACLAAGWFELTRALGGNSLSWAYVVEWPLIAVVGCYVWWRLVREERAEMEGVPEPDGEREPAPAASGEEAADPGLQAWRRYQAELHASDPPGGPPWESPERTG